MGLASRAVLDLIPSSYACWVPLCWTRNHHSPVEHASENVQNLCPWTRAPLPICQYNQFCFNMTYVFLKITALYKTVQLKVTGLMRKMGLAHDTQQLYP